MAPSVTAIRSNPLGSALMSEGVAGLRRVLTEEPSLLEDRQSREDLADTFLLLEIGLGRKSGDHGQLLVFLHDQLLDLADVNPEFVQRMLAELETVPLASARERVVGLTRFADSAQARAGVEAALKARSGDGQSRSPLLVLLSGFLTGENPKARKVLGDIVASPDLSSLFIDREIVQEMWSALQGLNRELEGSIPEARPHGFEAKMQKAVVLREILGTLVRRGPRDPRITEDLRKAYLSQ